MHKNQFLFSKKPFDEFSKGNIIKIRGYSLYIGDQFRHSSIIKPNYELHLLGDLYDWENPLYTNNEILHDLSKNLTIDQILQSSAKYAGEFVMIVCIQDELFLFNDACGQREVYYSDNFESFGSQPIIIGKTEELLDHKNNEANNYYQSKEFAKKYLFIHNTTHKKNITHLTPNHYINIREKRINRFFPIIKNETQSLDAIAKKASKMIKGYVEAISNRYQMLLGVTAGYDSRVLFLASLNTNCKYYVNDMPGMGEKHHDIIIAKELTDLYKKKLNIIEKDFEKLEFATKSKEDNYVNSLDFPSYRNQAISTNENEVVINGNISEIARNYHGYFSNATAKDLSFLNGNASTDFPALQYKEWLANKWLFKKLNYHYLDMFYWEDKMGNWMAKVRTEMFTIGRNVVTPYNSRDLLATLLSSKRKYRDSHLNILYDKIIAEISNQNKVIAAMPINPDKKQNMIRLLKRLRIYNIYRYIGLKTRMLKIQ